MPHQKHDYLIKNAYNTSQLYKDLKSIVVYNCYLIDIDNFSNINDAFGHKAGNLVLNQVFYYLNKIVSKDFKIYRFYADKFVILNPNHLEKEELIEFANSILISFSEMEFNIDNEDDLTIRLSLSIGISTGIGTTTLTNAELALKEVRSFSRNSVNIFNPMSEYIYKMQKNMYWIEKIKKAIYENETVVHYQPIINNKTGKIEKYECLIRLIDEDKVISPYLFLEAAKLTGNLTSLTQLLIIQSFKKFKNSDISFSINITSQDLLKNYLEKVLIRECKKNNVNCKNVTLELLESIETLEKKEIKEQLSKLREYGFKIAFDDFGAENSNFYKILEFNPDYVKIDGMFIKNINTDKKSRIITEAIVSMCKKSDIKMIAEYVHNKEVYNTIKNLGIEYSQGYFIGKPQEGLIDEDDLNL